MLPEWPRSLNAKAALDELLALMVGPTADRETPRLEPDLPWGEVHERALASAGLHPRWVRLETEDLPYLQAPTLLKNAEGGLWLVTARQREKVQIQGCESEQWISFQEMESKEGLEALELLRELPPGNLWMRIARLLWQFKSNIGVNLWITILGQGLALLAPFFMNLLMDRAFPDGSRSIFFVVVMGTILAGVFQLALDQIKARATLYLETQLGTWLDRGLLLHLLRAPFLWVQGRTIGQINQAFGGVSTARRLVADGLLGSIYGGITSLGYLFFMLALFPGGTALAMGLTLLITLWGLFMGYQLARLAKSRMKAQVAQRSALVELINGLPVLKAVAAEERLADRWSEFLTRDRYLGLQSSRLSQISETSSNLLNIAQTQAIVIWSGLMVVRGEMTLGNMMAFGMMATAFTSGISSLTSSVIQFWTAKPQLDLAQEFLAVPQEPVTSSVSMDTLPGPIELKGVSFRYGPDLPWIIKDLDMCIEPGEVHTIRGPSGYGKSTLLRLLAGLYEPEEGTITIAGQWKPSEARNLAVYLPQFVHLFQASIRENLRLFSGGASRERIDAAAEATGLEAMVNDLPMGYDTLLAQGGANISGGQRQLVALTAVLASDRPLLLLDEALANLDVIRKAELTSSDLFKGRTLVYASHDASWQCHMSQHA